jgi:predicted permease
MTRKVQAWLQETHGTRFELIRHFLPRFFDSELISTPGAWTRVAAGIAALLLSSWILLGFTLLYKYRRLAELNLTSRAISEMHADEASLAGIACCLTLLLLGVLWQSIYPTLRDCLALAAMPVSGADVFAAKFVSLTLVFAGFLIVMPLPSALVLSAMSGANPIEVFLTISAACASVFFGVIAIQGLLLNILPIRIFESAGVWMQAGLVAAAIGGFPYASSRGVYLPVTVIAALLVPALAAFATYAASYHRYRRLLVEGSPRSHSGTDLDLFTRIIDFLIRDPREQAAHLFFWKTLHRGRIHRLSVLLYASLAVAWIAQAAQHGSSDRETSGMLLTVYPLVLLMLTLFGMRQLFALPVELRANWLFQLTERDDRLAWMRGVERFVYLVGLVPVLAVGGVLAGIKGGLLVGLAWTTVAGLFAACAFEILFKGWRKLPFTCSYLPGKRPMIVNVAIFLFLSPGLLPFAWIIYHSATNPASLLVVLALEYGLWTLLRRARLRTWGVLPLRYEEAQESDVDVFALNSEGTTLAQEQFQREWSDLIRTGEPSDSILRPLDVGETHLSRIREWLAVVPQDVRFATRMLIKTPGFVFAIVMTLGLGLGLNSAFFTVFNAFLLRQLAVRDPASLSSVEFETRNRSSVHLTWPEYQILANHTVSRPFQETAASTFIGTGLEGKATFVNLVSGNYFSLLGAGIGAGRGFLPGEADAVMVLSYRTWQSRFGGDPSIIGRKLSANGSRFEVVGVAAPEFSGVPVGTAELAPKEFAKLGFGSAECWIPMEAWLRTPGAEIVPVRGIIGRTRSDTPSTKVEALLTGYARELSANRPQYDRVHRVSVETLDIPVTWTTLSYSFPLLIAFALTMIIPCANAANILLARAASRQREIGTRLALGAGRGRIVRQLLTESLLLAVLAAVAGLAVARVSLDTLSKFILATAPPTLLRRFRMPDLPLDEHVFGYLLFIAIVTTILFASAPAAQSTRVALSSALRGELASGYGFLRTAHLQNGLVVAQVSLCVMLLASSVLLLRGTGRILGIERGYDASGVYGVSNESPEDASSLARILSAEPWVDTLAVMARPLTELSMVSVADPARVSSAGWQRMYYHTGSGEILKLVGIQLVRGRTFTRGESENRSAVTVVSELAAKQLWPGEDPIGKTLAMQPPEVLANGQRDIFRPGFLEATVVGVTRDVVVKARDGGPRAVVRFPDKLRPGTILVVRGKGTAEQTRRNLETALARAPGSAKGAWVVGLQETVDWETYPQQAVSWLATLLSAVALLLTITGIYGVMAYSVSQRRKEIGIRMALGATSAQVAKFVLSYTTRLAGIGFCAGLVLAIGVLQFTASKVELLVNFGDVSAYLISFATAGVAALGASFGPTRRAIEVDPQSALRAE